MGQFSLGLSSDETILAAEDRGDMLSGGTGDDTLFGRLRDDLLVDKDTLTSGGLLGIDDATLPGGLGDELYGETGDRTCPSTENWLSSILFSARISQAGEETSPDVSSNSQKLA